MDRRRFLQLCGLGAAGMAAGAAAEAIGGSIGPLAGTAAAATRNTVLVGGAAVRPPAVPLAVRDPYSSTWLCGTSLPGQWSSGWNGPTTPVCGIVRIDGHPYVWCGAPGLKGVPSMSQTALEVTPTRTVFTLQGGGIELVAEWLSPIEPGNPQLQSVPLSLLTVTVASTDGVRHEVQLYCDISGQWASWWPTDEIVWQTSLTKSRHWTVELAQRTPLAERNQMAAWGAAVFSTPTTPHVTYQSGFSTSVRTSFADTGRLPNSVDPNFRAIDRNWPVFALARDLGSVGSVADPTYFSMGHFETGYGIKYLNENLPPLWESYWRSWQSMVDDFLGSASSTRQRARMLDAKVISDATTAGGANLAALCTLAARQAYGSCWLVRGPQGQPWAFFEELSSGGYISTVDVMLDSCAVWAYLDPGYLAMLLQPMLDYATSKLWTEQYAPHSLGLWPVASGNPHGAAAEPMPIQDTAAIVIMAAAYAKAVPAATAKAFLEPYSAAWTKWAELLISQLSPDGIPPKQLTTIDYMGALTANTNLAALGLVGIGAAAQIATILGESSNASKWTAKATQLTTAWQNYATDPSHTHLEGTMGTAGTWSNLCNAFWDTALGTNLIPTSVAAMQASFYQQKVGPYGLAVNEVWNQLGRVDQQLWTAGWLSKYPVGQAIIDAVVAYAGKTSYTVPLPDTYNTQAGGPESKRNWRARPVVGGVFAPLLVPKS